MTRQDMIAWLQAPSLGAPFGDKMCAIAAQIQADGETIAKAMEVCDVYVAERDTALARIAELEAALHNSEAQRIKMAEAEAARFRDGRAHMHIGRGMVSGPPADIEAALAEIVHLTEARDAAISALAEEGRKRGTAEAIIADMLRLDHEGSEEEWRAICARARTVLRPADGDAT